MFFGKTPNSDSARWLCAFGKRGRIRGIQTFAQGACAIAMPDGQTALVLRVILAFEVFAVVQALGGTLFLVLVGETCAYQFELLNGGAAATIALIILAISIAFTLIILRILRVPKGASI